MDSQQDGAGLRIALIGFGAIGRTLAEALRAHPDLAVVGILDRLPLPDAAAASVPEGGAVVDTLHDLLGLEPDVVVECAGHGALREHGATVLRRGTDLVVASVGALADAALEESLRQAAKRGGRILIPSGAIGGLDALGSARAAGIERVQYVGRKAPKAWRGTAAETMIDLDKVAEPTVFFESDARTTALKFPQNANVVAAVALAGIGFERTEVRLMVDPAEPSNQHSITATGPFGRISTQIVARTLPQNPKTSMLAPYSLIRTLRNLADPLVV
jgi:aspartate dehydrogenase